ncbi:MAG: Asp23/Gls24 family envelope stress response protein [Clostridiales bacterium]|nr:Asp23/Gls24 family envelope stress response protein [Clostridiales bacterium]HBM80159.1 Asp23/Gls24 family envelope stress response protein [Clostridiaceae bacterium]
MDENANINVSAEDDKFGTVVISEEVVSIIASLAASEIKGVASMSGGFVGGIAEKLGMKNTPKGIKAVVGEKETAIDLYINVEYGAKIPDVAWKVQENVKKAVETMTGLKVVEVNINVQGVDFGKEPKEEETPKVK